MKRCLIIYLFLVLMLPGIYAGESRVVGYYRSWNRNEYPHTRIPYQYLSHIAHAFIWPSRDGGLEVGARFLYPELISEAHKNGVKVVISLGGWGRHENFIPMVADPALRRKFVTELTEFCKKHG